MSGRAADGERALSVRGGLDEAVEIDLRAGELDCGVQPPGQLLVAQRVEDRGRLVAHLRAEGRLPTPREGAGQRTQCGGVKRRIADGLGGADSLLGPRLPGLIAQPVDLVSGEFQHQRDGGRAVGVRQVCKRSGEPPCAFVVAAKQMLHPRAGGDQRNAWRGRSGVEFDEPKALDERLVRFVEAAGRR